MPIVNAFKAAARLFNPEKVTELKLTASTTDEFKVFSFSEDAILNLKAELAEYMGIEEGVTNVNILERWVKNEDKLPNWSVAYKNRFVPAILCCSRKNFQYSEKFF